MDELENYKQFSEDFNTGKRLLLDYKNHKIECTVYGAKKFKYYPSVTGQLTFQDRIKKGLIKKISYKNPTQYFPISNNFIGSTMYPRPISIPFYNQKNIKEKALIDEIRQKALYNISKNKKIFLLEKNKSNLPNYFCTKLAIDSPKNRKRLIDLFNNEINNRKKEYHYQAKYYKKDAIFAGLSHQKNAFEKNFTKDIINGEKIPATNQKDINTKFKIINKLIIKKGLHKVDNDDEEEETNKIKNNTTFKIRKINEQDFINKNSLTNDNMNFSMADILNSKNKGKYRNLKITHSLSAAKENLMKIKTNKSRQKMMNNKTNTFNSSDIKGPLNKSMKFNSTVTTCYNYNSDIINSNNETNRTKNKNIFKNELYFPKLKRSLSDFQPNVTNIMNIKDDETNLNDISDMNERNKKIRNLKELKDYCEHETELLKGYKAPEIIETNEEIINIKPPNYISPETVYKKEMELFIKVNPIEYEKEMKRRLFDENLLKKKLQNKKIFERIKFSK